MVRATCWSLFLLAFLVPAARARGGEPGASGEAAAVGVEIVEGLNLKDPWTLPAAAPTEQYTAPAFGFVALPKKYTDRGVIADRSPMFLVRAEAAVALPAGRCRIVLRSLNAARLSVDGRLVAETRFLKPNDDGHSHVPDPPAVIDPSLHRMALGHAEKVFEFESDGRPHVVRLDAIVGGKDFKPEIGHLMVAVAGPGEPFRLLAPGGAAAVPLTEDGWEKYRREQVAAVTAMTDERRRTAAARDGAYWAMRHDWARRERGGATADGSTIDRLIDERLRAAGAAPTPDIDDYAFLRRVTLDVVGVIPTPEEIRAFVADPAPDRRARAIDRLLADPRWADAWVPYWQDVLAENPGILKPELNNTGPFRWWIYESFLDNKPVDRFVTELVLMEGSPYGGGPAGFARATQNDAPMAAKAHVLGTAFLGVEMKCARCHDAPHHDATQKDLFSLAAMLRREPQEVPKTSSVPVAAAGGESPTTGVRKLKIQVTLPPGAKVAPAWPFPDLVSPGLDDAPAGALRDPNDVREQLALLVTSPKNRRFAQVIANRVWKRYLGWGIVEPVDDWESGRPSHPALLEHLADELVTRDYDLKHLARLILNSRAYQRQAIASGAGMDESANRLFAGPARRRMSAEQVADSLFAAVGKEFKSEPLTMDLEGRGVAKNFQNLGTPTRAWQFTSLSNERDRPALAMPVAQSVIDLLQTFGWRESRPDPLTVREDATTVLQPLVLANGTAGHRAIVLSDDSAITALSLRTSYTAEQLVDELFLRTLSRPPMDAERQTVAELLGEGFEDRIVPEGQIPQEATDPKAAGRRVVSWSNHLSPEASEIKLELERRAREGDPPTKRLRDDWRRRAEDALWALVNSPEFVFVP